MTTKICQKIPDGIFSSPEPKWPLSIHCPFVHIFKKLSLKFLGQIYQISCGASLGWGSEISKMVLVCWPSWQPCPYTMKSYKIFSKTKKASVLNPCIKHQGCEVYQIYWNLCSRLTFDLFTASSICFIIHLSIEYICTGNFFFFFFFIKMN